MTKRTFVCGFAFNETKDYVALLRKQGFPTEIAGKWNGVGGGIGLGEGIRTAIAREFNEEAGVLTKAEDWTCFHSARYLNGNICHMLTTVLSPAQFRDVRTTGHEIVQTKQVSSTLFDLAEAIAEGATPQSPTEIYLPVAYLLPMALIHLTQPAGLRNLGY